MTEFANYSRIDSYGYNGYSKVYNNYNTGSYAHSRNSSKNKDEHDAVFESENSTASDNGGDQYAEYNDPILSLIAGETINTTSLQLVLRTLPVSDKPLIKYINKAHKVQLELQKLKRKLTSSWEFIAMERNIRSVLKNDSGDNDDEENESFGYNDGEYNGYDSSDDESNKENILGSHSKSANYRGKSKADVLQDPPNPSEVKFNSDLAKVVAQKCVELHQTLYELNYTINDVNKLVTNFSPMQYVSDAGVLLTDLTLKIIELKNSLNENLNINYSKAKLIVMESDLETLLFEFNDSSNSDSKSLVDDATSIITSNHPIISNDLAKTIENYKDFAVTILNQLNEAQDTNDTDEISECLAVIADLEKMFDALIKQIYDPELTSDASMSTAKKYEESIFEESEILEDDELNDTIPEMNEHTATTTPKRREEPNSNTTSSSSQSHFSPTTTYNTIFEEEVEKSPTLPKNESYGTEYEQNDIQTTQSQGKTTLSDELPNLLRAFDNVRNEELELRDTLLHEIEETEAKLITENLHKKTHQHQHNHNHNHKESKDKPVPKQLENGEMSYKLNESIIFDKKQNVFSPIHLARNNPDIATPLTASVFSSSGSIKIPQSGFISPTNPLFVQDKTVISDSVASLKETSANLDQSTESTSSSTFSLSSSIFSFFGKAKPEETVENKMTLFKKPRTLSGVADEVD